MLNGIVKVLQVKVSLYAYLNVVEISFKIFSEYITAQNNLNGFIKTEQLSLLITAIVYQGQILKEKLGTCVKRTKHTHKRLSVHTDLRFTRIYIAVCQCGWISKVFLLLLTCRC